MLAPDSIEPVTFLVLLTIIVAIWMWLGLRRDARLRRYAEALYRALSWSRAAACARLWSEGEQYHVCTRPFEHTGPCLDDIHKVVRR